MRQPNVDRWKYKKDSEGLLLFAQLVEEMVFDYTLDSYRAPALNTHYLCTELLATIKQVRDADLEQGVLRPVLDELKASLSADVAARALLGAHHVPYLEELSSNDSSLATLDAVATQIRTTLRHRYLGEIMSRLKALVPVGIEKEVITTLTKSLVSELINAGVSQGYIYSQTRKSFFEKAGPKIDDCGAALESFLAALTIAPKTWEVLFKASADFKLAKGLAARFGLEVMDPTPAARTAHYREAEFLAGAGPDQVFLALKNVKAVDPEAARKKAEAPVSTTSSIARLHLHDRSLSWENEALVYGDGGFVLELDLPKPAALKRPDCALHELGSLTERTLSSLADSRVNQESQLRVLRSLSLHSAALDAPAEETQLLGFWSALETLLPPPPKNRARIAYMGDVLVPVLARAYPEKLLRDLAKSLRVCCGGAAAAIVQSSKVGDSFLTKLAGIVAIEDQKGLRTRLYELMKRNPLLANRLYTLKRGMESAGAIDQLIHRHTQRVSWHLQRIYRSRNLLIHTGKQLPYLPTLIENLHTYLDWTLFLLRDVLIRRPECASLDAAFLEVRLDHQAHLRALEADRTAGARPENLQVFVFGGAVVELFPPLP